MLAMPITEANDKPQAAHPAENRETRPAPIVMCKFP